MKDEDLEKLLDLYEGAKPSPGLKARILSSVRKPHIFRYLVPLAAAAGILIAVFIVNNIIKPVPRPIINRCPVMPFSEIEAMEIDENADLLNNYEVVQCVDLVEDENTMKNLEDFVQ